MPKLSTTMYLSGLILLLSSLVVSGCATHDAKRDDETYKRPTKAEKQQAEQEESSQK